MLNIVEEGARYTNPPVAQQRSQKSVHQAITALGGPVSDFLHTGQLSAIYDSASRAVWMRMTPRPRPCFNPVLLRDLERYCQQLTESQGRWQIEGKDYPVDYAVLSSADPYVFNLGGDLELFIQLIRNRNRVGLTHYGRACIEVVYRNYMDHRVPIQTLAQGECLGGGFESALSSDTIVAERSARFGFPEVLFNLFPGMGACSLLERKIGCRPAQEVIASGEVYSADDMLQRGVVDLVVNDGEGEAAVHQLLKKRRRMNNGLKGIAQAHRRTQRLSFQELEDIVDIWVERAMALTSRDLKLMKRLVARQDSGRA